ncbi:hypothetical protein P8C59_007486 [Phyllachora maydis]|uniref:Uncharacterized protein n=1 Tax=Phyllachora maydis TaxID=1825666 RepID=A0AAD9MGY7_9PEZI|nr:hypothetical protein P8C59_007486 [Phyllachora maydis]
MCVLHLDRSQQRSPQQTNLPCPSNEYGGEKPCLYDGGWKPFSCNKTNPWADNVEVCDTDLDSIKILELPRYGPELDGRVADSGKVR